MGLEIGASILGLILSLLGAGLASTKMFQGLIRVPLKQKKPTKSYSERLTELIENLSKASREVDAVLTELARVAKERANAVQQLENDLVTMEGREKELKERIDALEKTPLVIAEHFAKLVAPSEKRSAMRDYLLFGSGVVVSTAISIVIQIFV